jgi:acetoin utilization protein AcuB
MFASQILSTQYPVLQTTDKVSFALQLMNDYDVQQLAVTNLDLYTGLVDKDDLLDADEKAPLHSLESQFVKTSVLPDEHFLFALRLCADFGLTLVPVVTKDKQFTGLVTQKDLINTLYNFLGKDEPGGIIVMEIDKKEYSFGEINRLVETNNAVIRHLNSSVNPVTQKLEVTIKINKLEIADIISTLQRYDYTITYYFGEELYENELKENYDLLMNYLRM